MSISNFFTFSFVVKVYHKSVFFIDLNINEHKVFFRELLSLCEAEDAVLGKLPCYKGVNLVPLRASALKALAACHYIQEKHCREKIFQVLYKSLEKNDQELQQVSLTLFISWWSAIVIYDGHSNHILFY